MNKDTPQPHTVKTKKTGERQKGKNVSKRAKPASVASSIPENSSENIIEEDENEIKARIAQAKEELKVLEAQKEALAEEVAKASDDIPTPKVERPRGVSIQVGMGLSDNKHKYDAIRRLVGDLCMQVGINWELPWADISASKKAKLYQVACEEAPYLKRFANDWPTQALAMQLMKNKRAHSYRRGYLEVPARYAYLKETAAKRRTGHSCATTSPLSECEGTGDSYKSTLEPTAVASGSKRKAQAPTQPPRKKQRVVTTRAASSKAKGKGKAVEREHNDEIPEDEVAVGEDSE